MNDYILALVLGVVEGLTEFLPISSTAHIRIAQSLLGLDLEDSFWAMFAVVIQLGAILSVVIYFWQRLLGFLKPFQLQGPVLNVAAAFLTTVLPAFLLSKIIGDHLKSLTVMGHALWIGGVAMILIDRTFKDPRIFKLEQLSLPQSIWIGAVQVLSAVFPGTSRSMSTIAGGQLVGMSRSAALEFSFFLSIPTMAAATGYDFLKTLKGGLILSPHQGVLIAIGFLVSMISGYAVIAGFMNWVKTRGFMPFAVYRIALGAYLLIRMAN